MSSTIPAVLLAVALADAAVTVFVLATSGAGGEGLHALNRYLVRISFPLFCLAFSASALRTLWPGAATRWLVANRRALGLGFALGHFVHGAAIVALLASTNGPPPSGATLAVGGLGYVLLAAMAATSNDASQRRLGARRWRRLHLVGGWLLWGIFTVTYAGRVSAQGAAFLPGLAACVGILGVRASAALRRRSVRTALPA